MSALLRYGIDSTLELPDRPDARILPRSAEPPQADDGRDLNNADQAAQAARAALAAPIELPPLGGLIFAGDRVALPLDPELPYPAALTAVVVEYLAEAGFSPADLLIVAAETLDEDPRAELPNALRRDVGLEIHNPAERRALAYLAATSTEQRVYLNARLADADVVVPIGAARYDVSVGPYSGSSMLYPAFSDLETQRRFRTAILSGEEKLLTVLRKEVEEAGWFLGAQFYLQATPGFGSLPPSVFAGDARQAAKQAAARWAEGGRLRFDKTPQLVAAAIDAPPDQQTWKQVGRAVAAASALAAEGGSIVVCCDLGATKRGAKFGPGLGWLARGDRSSTLLRRLQHDCPEDAETAWRISEALAKQTVYLLSRMAPEPVENLGMAPVESPADAMRLIQRSTSFAVLDNAQHVQIELVEGD